jgi:hypothetical protein
MKHKLLLLVLCLISFIGVNAQDKFTATVEFVVNTDFIIDNGHNYQFYHIDLPKIKERASEIDYVYLIGSASPEGDFSNNESLVSKRANKVFSQLSDFVPENKIIINNSHDLFMKKTGFKEYDYPGQRAVYVEFVFVEDKPVEHKVDTVYVNTVLEKRDTVFVVNEVVKENKSHFSVYTDLVLDGFAIPNIGFEYAYGRFGVFLDGAYSNWLGKKVTDANFGFRLYSGKRVNGIFIEVLGKYSAFDVTNYDKVIKPKITKMSNAFGVCFGLGWRFNASKHLGFSLYARCGYVKDFLDYENNYNVISDNNKIIIAPYINEGAKYFGLTNVGANMIIRF